MLDKVNHTLQSLTEDEKKYIREKLTKQLQQTKETLVRHPHALSQAQQRLWVLQQLNPCDFLYHVPMIMTVPESMDFIALEQACQHVIQENPVLASAFSFQNEEIIQSHPHTCEIVMMHVTMDDDLPDVLEISAASPLADFFLKKFDIEKAPLWRIGVLNTPNQRFFIACFHHLIMDGWSVALWFKRVDHYYGLIKQAGVEQVSLARDDYFMFVAWELAQNKNQEQQTYWLNRLAHKPLVVDLITDYPRKLEKTGAGKTIFQRLLIQHLSGYAKQIGVSINQLVLFAFQFMLARYSGQDDITVGIPVAGRAHPRWYQTIGLFVNTCLHTTSIEYNATLHQHLQYLKQTLLLDLAHANQPFDDVVKALYARGQPNQNMIFNVLYNFIQLEQEDEHGIVLDGIPCTTRFCTLPVSKFDLSLHVYARGSELDILLEFSTDLYEERTMLNMLNYMLCVLEELPSHHEATLKQLSVACHRRGSV